MTVQQLTTVVLSPLSSGNVEIHQIHYHQLAGKIKPRKLRLTTRVWYRVEASSALMYIISELSSWRTLFWKWLPTGGSLEWHAGVEWPFLEPEMEARCLANRY